MTCPEPEFTWVEERGWWSACTRCGRLAWDHEQADPLRDIFNAIEGKHSPPGMKPLREKVA